MDTVYGVDHPFQTLTWLDEGVLGGPGRGGHEGRDRGHACGAEGGGDAPEARQSRLRSGHQQRRGSGLARLGAPPPASGAGARRRRSPTSLGAARTARWQARARAAAIFDLHQGQERPCRPQSGGRPQRHRGRRRPRSEARQRPGPAPVGQSGPDRRRAAQQRGSGPRRPAGQHAALHSRGRAARQGSLDAAVAMVAAEHEVRSTSMAASDVHPSRSTAGGEAVRARQRAAAPISARASTGAPPAASATATTSPPAECRSWTRWASAAAPSTVRTNI
jgi:hypothetical protein